MNSTTPTQPNLEKWLGSREAWRRFKWRILAGFLCYVGARPDLTGPVIGIYAFLLPFLIASLFGIMGARLRDGWLTVVATYLLSLGIINVQSLTGRPPNYRNPEVFARFLMATCVYFLILMIPATLAYIIARERSRRIRPGFCARCDYNLTGNVSGKCPECGTPINDGKILN